MWSYLAFVLYCFSELSLCVDSSVALGSVLMILGFIGPNEVEMWGEKEKDIRMHFRFHFTKSSVKYFYIRFLEHFRTFLFRLFL
jgi:hypothetical protein